MTAADATSTRTGLVDVGTVRLSVSGSGVAAVNLQIILLVTADVSCQSNCPQDRTENVPAVAGSGFVALSTRRRLSELYATPPSMLDIAYPRRTFSRALSGSNTSCTSCHENVYGDVDGDGVFNVGDSLQVQLIALGESDCAVSAMCPWRQQQANPTRVLDSFGNPQVTNSEAEYLLHVVTRRKRFLDNVAISCEAGAIVMIATVMQVGDTIGTFFVGAEEVVHDPTCWTHEETKHDHV